MWNAVAAIAAVIAVVVSVIALRRSQASMNKAQASMDKSNQTQEQMLEIEQARRRDELAPDFELAYEPTHPDPNYPECGRLLLTYEGNAPCERLVIDELRDARWASAVREVVRWAPHTSASRHTTDIHQHLQPGEVRPFIVRLDPKGELGEIRFRFTATVDGHEYPPIVRSCQVTPPPSQPLGVYIE